jgi:hypothetical protein
MIYSFCTAEEIASLKPNAMINDGVLSLFMSVKLLDVYREEDQTKPLLVDSAVFAAIGRAVATNANTDIVVKLMNKQMATQSSKAYT